MAPTIMLRTAVDHLGFEAATGRLVSLRPSRAPDLELLASAPDHPAFALQVLTPQGEFRQLDSRSVEHVSVDCATAGGRQTLTMVFAGVGGMDVDVTLTVAASSQDRFSRWGCVVRNGAALRVVDVQFPFVVAPLEPDAAVVLPAGHGGHLMQGQALEQLPADEPCRWQLIPANGNSPHYPGRVFAQFLAWYTPRAGLYLACDDTEGNVKMIRPFRRGQGIRLGVAHVGDWPTEGERTLEYEVVLGSFVGDWYDAAEVYRQWSLRQRWATPLTERSDIPQWLLDSPPHITIRLQGYVDAGPAPPVEEFLPYEKCVPLLAGIAERVEAPLVAVLMSWEHGGPWVYPDCFPPVGGDESLTRFCSMARERGWHVGSFCNGTRWVLEHLFNNYDGRSYYEQHHGEQSVCRQHNGELWQEVWDRNWRPSFICCMAQDMTKTLAVDFVRRLVGWGMESIQFFDQNCNAATFPCFAATHGHPPVPGKWMAEAMEEMIAAYRRVAADAGEPGVIQSTEMACNEYCLQLFQQSDVRPSAPCCGDPGFIPLYHFLFHECTILHGMMSIGPEPFALEIRTAWGCVFGQIPGAVMTGDGTLLNRETYNWAEWEPKVGSNDDALEMIRTVTAMRRGPGRDFLVYGRMQRPAEVVGIEAVSWEHAGRHYGVPAVAHAAWQAPDGRVGVVLANWTREERCVVVVDPRLAPEPAGERTVHTCARQVGEARRHCGDDRIPVAVPPLGCVLVC